MGLSPSAGWAQAVTDQTTTAAELPQHSRVRIHEPVPEEAPFWGSIVDDVWVVDTDEQPVGPEWCGRVFDEWVKRGVEPHPNKIVDAAEGEEIQGVYVDPERHWLGVSLEKRGLLMRFIWRLLGQTCPRVCEVDRAVGKLGFAMSFNMLTRSVLTQTFKWLSTFRGKSKRAFWWPAVHQELVQGMLMIPFMQFNLSQTWTCRVEAADASPGGHGRAWTHFPEQLVRDLCRLSDHKGAYTNLGLDFGIETTGDEVCPLHRTHWPMDAFKWTCVGSPRGFRSIVLEEMGAQAWSLEQRLRRSDEVGKRCLQGCDSASGTGALLKGRSPSRAVNGMCKKIGAICLAGGLSPFWSWLPTKENPADEPSSWHGVRSRSHRQPTALHEQRLPSHVGRPVASKPIVLHLCSDPRRAGNFHECASHWFGTYGTNDEVWSVGPDR